MIRSKAKRAPADFWDPAKNAWARSPRGLAEAVEGRTLFRTARAPGPSVQPRGSQPRRPTGFAPREPHRRRSLSPPFASSARAFGVARLVQPAPFALSSPPIPQHWHPFFRHTHLYAVADSRTGARDAPSSFETRESSFIFREIYGLFKITVSYSPPMIVKRITLSKKG